MELRVSGEPQRSAGLDGRGGRRHLTGRMTTTVSSKGQIVLPAEIRLLDDVKPGEQFEVERIERGEYRLKRKTPPGNAGLVDWLLSCPEKGWFEPLDRKEMTGGMKPPKLG